MSGIGPTSGVGRPPTPALSPTETDKTQPAVETPRATAPADGYEEATGSAAEQVGRWASPFAGATTFEEQGQQLDLDKIRSGSATMGPGAKGEAVRRLQELLKDQGYRLGVDGVFGRGETQPALKAFQQAMGLEATGRLDQPTLAALEGHPPTDTAPPRDRLDNARFADDPTLQKVFDGDKTLRRRAKGEAVTKVQQALIDLGFEMPRFGADGGFGAETATALRRFQRAHDLDPTGQLDAATLAKLDEVAPPPGQRVDRFPEYDKLFADGVLDVAIGVGYDENGWGPYAKRDVLKSIRAQGFEEVRPEDHSREDLEAMGIDPADVKPGVRIFHRTLTYEGREVQSVVRLFDETTPGAVDRYQEALQKADVVMYGGHARYGTGPDFDEKTSPAGNFVLGVNSSLHRSGQLTPGYDSHMNELLEGAPNRLEGLDLPEDKYQLWYFNGCSTINYLDELRGGLAEGKDDTNLDVIGSTRPLYWNNVGANLGILLSSLQEQVSVGTITRRLQEREGGEEGAFFTDGFGDNRYGVGG